MTTNWQGVTLDERMAAQMTQVATLCGTIPVQPSQGSYSGGVSASGGTHDGCGAIDVKAVDLTSSQRQAVVATMRQVGIAAWLRTPAQSDWPYHIHGISVQAGGKHDRGCLSAAAHGQVVDYFEGRNGLASGGPDDGPRNWVGVTWEEYLAAGEDHDMTPDQDKILRDTFNRAEWNHQDLIWIKNWIKAVGPQLNNIDQHANSAMSYANQTMTEQRAIRDTYIVPTFDAVTEDDK